MPLECIMILLDNSLFSRNGDALPSRYQSQLEAITSVVNYKSNDNPETSVGLMAMAGKGKQILTTPTNDPSAVYSQFSKIQIQELVGVARSIQIGQLTMKHRVNKNQHERMIIFLASAIKENPEDLYVLARNLRRNLIAVDIINICSPENTVIIQNFIEIVNVDDNSHFINFPGGVARLNDALKESGILGGHQTAEGGFQEELDPELEMVLRISLEEERKRQEELEKGRSDQSTQQPKGMVIEDQGVDEESARLLSEANEIVKESDSKGNNLKKDNQYLQDPKFIQDILSELKLKDDKSEESKKKKEEENQKQEEAKRKENDKK